MLKLVKIDLESSKRGELRAAQVRSAAWETECSWTGTRTWTWTDSEEKTRRSRSSGRAASPSHLPVPDRMVRRLLRIGPRGFGQVRSAHYFGEELVLFRTASGKCMRWTPTVSASAPTWASAARVEARTVAPGTVGSGASDGTNALIPYSKIGCKNDVRIRTYPVVEWYGFVLVWHERRRPRALLATTGAARAGNRRVLPAAPAHAGW